jgi:hypothetical protein
MKRVIIGSEIQALKSGGKWQYIFNRIDPGADALKNDSK